MKAFALFALTIALVAGATLADNALAADAVANLQVWQSQTLVGNNQPVTLGQQSDALTEVWLGNSAAAISHQQASQLGTGVPTVAQQSQDLQANSAIWWEDDKWPAWARTNTGGNTSQHQAHWAAAPADLQQTARNKQHSFVDGQSSTADGTATQRQQGAVGDLHQGQALVGNTIAAGYAVPPFPAPFSANFGGGFLRQHISFAIDNIVNFF